MTDPWSRSSMKNLKEFCFLCLLCNLLFNNNIQIHKYIDQHLIANLLLHMEMLGERFIIERGGCNVLGAD